eukprot:TRINITY_DN8370_c0_g1_i3.p1 TRINITY_DN8370_c0_g1~~TRINITY_DN8370_c0_g1_i3.p1  ORF type:complete len:617 (-),score=130.66 TRINITY_DN8370_c0_g1_i3:68-1918(-)
MSADGQGLEDLAASLVNHAAQARELAGALITEPGRRPQLNALTEFESSLLQVHAQLIAVMHDVSGQDDAAAAEKAEQTHEAEESHAAEVESPRAAEEEGEAETPQELQKLRESFQALTMEAEAETVRADEEHLAQPEERRRIDGCDRAELLMLVAGLLRRKRDRLLMLGTSARDMEHLESCKEDLARVERELRARSSGASATAEQPVEQTRSDARTDKGDSSSPAAEVGMTPATVGSTATPATDVPSTAFLSPLPQGLEPPPTWTTPTIQLPGVEMEGALVNRLPGGPSCPSCGGVFMPDSNFCHDCGTQRQLDDAERESPKPVLQDSSAKLPPSAESGDAVLIGSARDGASVAARGIPADEQHTSHCGKENVRPRESQEIVTPRPTLGEAAAKASPLQQGAPCLTASPSPLCVRAQSTPGRRAASSFGSSGLFRETPSPRTKPQRDAKLQSPMPSAALQPKSLMFTPPPRYGGAVPQHAATHATSCSPARPAAPPLPGSGIGRCGTSPNKAVPAFPLGGQRHSPIRALPGGISATVVARSPSAPCLGRSDAALARHGGRWLSRAAAKGSEASDGGTPRNLVGFRKSLEMALKSDMSQVRKQQQQQQQQLKAKPWK